MPHGVRLYSIAASRYGDKFDGKTTSLCVRRAEYWDPEMKANDPAKKGICSNFLCDAKPGDEINMTGWSPAPRSALSMSIDANQPHKGRVQWSWLSHILSRLPCFAFMEQQSCDLHSHLLMIARLSAGPTGKVLLLPEDPNAVIIMVATGTGNALDLQAWGLGCCSSSAALATRHVWYVITMLNSLQRQRQLLRLLVDHVSFPVQALHPTTPSAGNSSWRTPAYYKF